MFFLFILLLLFNNSINDESMLSDVELEIKRQVQEYLANKTSDKTNETTSSTDIEQKHSPVKLQKQSSKENNESSPKEEVVLLYGVFKDFIEKKFKALEEKLNQQFGKKISPKNNSVEKHASECVDKIAGCGILKTHSLCITSRNTMKKLCAKTCQLCNEKTKSKSGPPPKVKKKLGVRKKQAKPQFEKSLLSKTPINVARTSNRRVTSTKRKASICPKICNRTCLETCPKECCRTESKPLSTAPCSNTCNSLCQPKCSAECCNNETAFTAVPSFPSSMPCPQWCMGNCRNDCPPSCCSFPTYGRDSFDKLLSNIPALSITTSSPLGIGCSLQCLVKNCEDIQCDQTCCQPNSNSLSAYLQRDTQETTTNVPKIVLDSGEQIMSCPLECNYKCSNSCYEEKCCDK